MMLVICLRQRSCQTIAVAMFCPPLKYIVVVFKLLMTLTLYFLSPASILSNLARCHHNSRPSSSSRLLPSRVCHHHQTIASCLLLPSPLACHSCLLAAAASCQPPSLSPSHVCHRCFLLFTMVSSSYLPLLSLVCRHCPLWWLNVTSWNATWLSSLSSSSLPLLSLLHCFVAVVTITRLHCHPHLSLLLPSCNALKLEARWRGLEIDEFATL
jgi:hypothetical protein